MLPEWTIVGFTGHRTLDDPDVVAADIRAALDRMASRCGSLAIVSSAASGADMLFLEEVTRRKLPSLLILPFAENRFEKDFDPAVWRRVQAFIGQALTVETVTDAHSDDEAYMEAGERMVSQADVVMAVWNGKASGGLGGTGDVVEFARKLGKPIIWIDPTSNRVIEERLDLLRVKSGAPLLHEDPRKIVEKHFSGRDEAATRHGPKARHLIQRIILLHLLASAVGLSIPTLGLHGSVDYVIVLFELVLLATAFVLTSAHRRRHEEWMKTRIEAEICRSFLATWQMRDRVNLSSKSAIQGFDNLFKNLRLFQLLDATPIPHLEVSRDGYLQKRVLNQLDYFSRETKNAQAAYHGIKVATLSCTAIATLFTASVLALSYFQVEGLALHVPKLLSLVLPLVSAALFSIALTQEYSRRAARYQEMVSVLQDAAKHLGAIKTQNGLAHLASETEHKLLQEIAEWHSFTRFAGEPH